MSEKLYGVDQFYPGDFAPILTGVYIMEGCIDQVPVVHAVIWLIMLVDCNIRRMRERAVSNRNPHGEIDESLDCIYPLVTGCFLAGL